MREQIFFIILLLFVFAGCSSKEISQSSSKKRSSEDSNLGSKAYAQCLKGHYREAQNEFEKEYLSRRGQASFWLEKGNCQFHQQNYRKAQLFYNKGIELKPNDPMILNNLALLFLRREEDDKALSLLRKSYSLDPKSESTRINLAQLYNRYGMSSKSAQLLSVDQHTGNPLVMRELALAYYQLAQFSQARSLYERLKKSSSLDEGDELMYALSLYYEGSVQKSREILKNISINYTSSYYNKYKEAQKIIGG